MGKGVLGKGACGVKKKARNGGTKREILWKWCSFGKMREENRLEGGTVQ